MTPSLAARIGRRSAPRAALAALTALIACRGEHFTLAAGDTWIRDVTVVSMERAAPQPGVSVVVRDDRIVWVGDAPQPVEGVREIDGTGRFLIPGLIDGHVHLSAPPPGLTSAASTAHPEFAAAYERQLPRSFLFHGFTTVVELGIKDRAVLSRVRAAPEAPTVLDCGDPLVIANGYPMPMRRPVDERLEAYPNFLYDPTQAATIPSRFAAADHTPAAAVARVRAGGAACVKAFYEPGDPREPFPLPTIAMMREAVDAARTARLPLLLHANSVEAHRFTSTLAPAATAHGLWSWPGLMTAEPGAPLPDSLVREVHAILDAERSAGIAYMPTLRVISGLIDLDGRAFLDSPALARVVPADLLAWYASDEGRAAAADDNPGGAVTTILRSASALGVQSLAYVSKQGGRVVFGSDTPSGGGYGNPPGLNGYLELREMEAAGLSPAQVLTAATLENARLFGIDGEVGTIAIGRRADVLLLDRDPLESTSALDAIRLIILRGRTLERASLSTATITRKD